MAGKGSKKPRKNGPKASDGGGRGRKPGGEEWIDRVLETQFLQLEPGRHRMRITGEPSMVQSKRYGTDQLQLPTEDGIISSGAYSFMRPVAKAKKAKGRLRGLTVSFTLVGEGIDRRFENVAVS